MGCVLLHGLLLFRFFVDSLIRFLQRLYLYSKKGLTHFDSLCLYAPKSNHCAYSCGGSFHLELFKTKGKAIPPLFTIYAVRLNSFSFWLRLHEIPRPHKFFDLNFGRMEFVHLKIEGESFFVFGSQ